MELESVNIPATNDFASLYIKQKEPVKGFFHYDITENAVFEKRYKDVMNAKYKRQELASCIETYMKRFPHSEKTEESISKLRDASSTVVIGGQQAGLLMGPLFTIHKIISIIKLAEQQENLLGKPVVPVFWIAGEDHDFLEINHLYTESNDGMKKTSFSGMNEEKRMVSDIHYDQNQMLEWVNLIFEQFGERKHTNEMITLIHEAVQSYDTFTDFFTYLVTYLFKDYGLLVIDSADKQLRQLEKPYFSRLIENNTEITSAVLSQQDIIENNGFNLAMEVESSSANLFYYINNERILLEFDRTRQLFLSKKTDLVFTKEELFDLLEQYPERFSNNVVTRPMMQEWLFPTLAFIAGPGEIAYWGELKQAFELVNSKMPPIIPRLNISFVESAIERDVEELNLSLQNVIENGISNEREAFIQSVSDQELTGITEKVKDFLVAEYSGIYERVNTIDASLLPLAEKNLAFHLKQFDFLQNKVDISIRSQHKTIINKYDRIERHLSPEKSFQERIWNIFYYLNIRGEMFIHHLMDLEFEFDGKHKIIKI
ncbi:bacillithiol biosynthesis cysteine-adding enzyme BshC [Lederbergia lenta]|uniref:bacillithiol biosynthesis cysteine-adding enzyme BshC n=1 Tax=Lederbergia lenta TaxID=1467 RepID=UPI00203EB57A|nr:bacillithiol biosynthesis cysteine-adding enzyme BshC [Lederbergia lenta]MCM3110247.1 bacillithiol biosynthesis cysteine-adding enzyme BshC [Lederbergia lenta]